MNISALEYRKINDLDDTDEQMALLVQRVSGSYYGDYFFPTAAGVGFSLCIEILQLPFFDRVTDVDDLILNSIGFLIGYGAYLLVRVQK